METESENFSLTVNLADFRGTPGLGALLRMLRKPPYTIRIDSAAPSPNREEVARQVLEWIRRG